MAPCLWECVKTTLPPMLAWYLNANKVICPLRILPVRVCQGDASPTLARFPVRTHINLHNFFVMIMHICIWVHMYTDLNMGVCQDDASPIFLISKKEGMHIDKGFCIFLYHYFFLGGGDGWGNRLFQETLSWKLQPQPYRLTGISNLVYFKEKEYKQPFADRSSYKGKS